ncbi:threonine/serine exporter family protein [Leuconostocaceae bacterium ESL0958]|nr:threonine/serine exporter family protein [Leuconostocaceae bacterium ESL0958]
MTKNNQEAALRDSKHPAHLHHHMSIAWEKVIANEKNSARDSSLPIRASIVGRVGILLLSCGTGAWRVREAMNRIAYSLGVTCSADIGFTTLTFTCYDGVNAHSQTLALPTSGVNTTKLATLEHFIADFPTKYASAKPSELHQRLDAIKNQPSAYPASIVGLAAGLACAGFIFLLGGGPIEMLGCFCGAAAGNYSRKKLGQQHWTGVATTAMGVAMAALVYFLVFHLLNATAGVSRAHEAGYIGAMLFVIPGFPFITSILDITKNDMRSGLERLTSAVLTITTATLVGWLLALIFNFQPQNFLPQGLALVPLIGCRLLASFAGVLGFSIMFNSKFSMAVTAGLIGAVANTSRLELVDLGHLPPAAAALIGALIAGLIASAINHKTHYPRISLTVPAIVIMVPGLYIYRGIYNLGLNHIPTAAIWLSEAALIMLALPFGLYIARFLLDERWRKVD